MAQAIDTKHLLERWIPRREDHECTTSLAGRLQLCKVYAHATVIQDASTAWLLNEPYMRPTCQVKQEALDWQAEQDDDLDDAEVFHHLTQMGAATTSPFPEAPQTSPRTDSPTTLVASAQSPKFTVRAQRRPLTTFHRYSLRISMFRNYSKDQYSSYDLGYSALRKVVPDARNFCWWPWRSRPKIVWPSRGQRSAVLWHLQLDFVDLHNPRIYPISRLGKRRRTINPFMHISPRSGGETTREDRVPKAKKFKGVRYRKERRTWVAEMKPPHSRNKVSFGDFKSEAEAARAVDAAFHHYCKPHMVNFADTPRILSTRPPPTGLSGEEKVKFLKQEGKWLASNFADSSPPDVVVSVALEIPESPTGHGTAFMTALELRSFSEITSSTLSLGSDDGVSQLLQDIVSTELNSVSVDNQEVQSASAGGPESFSGAFANFMDSSGDEGSEGQRWIDFLKSPPA